MPERPNLDYDPGQAGASSSRIGPLAAPGAMGPTPAAPPLGPVNMEVAGELGVPGRTLAGAGRTAAGAGRTLAGAGRRAKGARRSRRKFGFR